MTDPVTLEVQRNALQSIAEEMGVTLIRTALSPNIKDRRDCSTAIYTATGDLVAQAEHIPLHLGIMPSIVKKILELYPPENLAPNDAIISNDPYINGSHLPDICLITPVFIKNELTAIVANLAHHVDVGGAVPGSMSTVSTEVFQEGIRIPPIKLYNHGEINQEVMELLTYNIRTNETFHGDLQAQYSTNLVGCKRLQELVQKTGLDFLRHQMEDIIDYTERRFRAALAFVPSGTYRYFDYLEGDGISNNRIKIALTLQITEDKIIADFTGTDDQVKGPINATPGVTQACVYFAVKAVLDPELPSNEGIARVVETIVPKGSLLNPHFPAPVAHANINTAQRITDVILGALAQALPHQVTAAGTGSMSLLAIGGLDQNKEYFSYIETYGGGQGGKYGQDGMDGVHVNMTNTRNTPVEVIEMSYPLRVEKYALRPDTGGAGQFRGGTGLTRQITLLTEAHVSVSSERNTIKPWGLEGGLPGGVGRCYLETPAGEKLKMPGKYTKELPAGTVITLETAGGGGYGPVKERTQEAISHDGEEGLTTT
jgi:N-methylhydantoinase B